MSYEPTVWVDGDHVTSAKLNKLEQGVNSMSYTPTMWNAGDVVTAEKLNKLEQGVAEGGGGGGGEYPTVTVNIDAEKLYCSLSFGEEYEVNALYDYGTYYTYSYNFTDEQLSETTAEFLMIGESFALYPYADFDLPDGVTVTGSATYDDETHTITVTGDCSIHLIGFDE